MPEQASTTCPCPFCKEEVKIDAVRCKHCQATIVSERPAHGGVCPFCLERIHLQAVRCKHCKADLGSASYLLAEFPKKTATPIRRRRMVSRPERAAADAAVDPSGCPIALMDGPEMWCLEFVEWDIDTNQTYCVYQECGFV